VQPRADAVPACALRRAAPPARTRRRALRTACRDRERKRELDSKRAAAAGGEDAGAPGGGVGGADGAPGAPGADRPPEAERPVLKDTGVGTDDTEMEPAAAAPPPAPPAADEVRAFWSWSGWRHASDGFVLGACCGLPRPDPRQSSARNQTRRRA